MNKLATALLSTSALLAAGTAAAEGPEWTYGQLGYYQGDSFGDDQTDGVTLDGSLGFLDIWHVQAGFIDGSLGQGDADNDFDGWSVTVGAHPSITADSQLVINGTFFDTSYDADAGPFGDSVDRDGYGFGVGVRTNVTDKVEASVIASWTDSSFDEDDASDTDATDISIAFGGRYNWTENFSTGATVVIGDPVILGSDNSMNLDVRWTFAGFSL